MGRPGDPAPEGGSATPGGSLIPGDFAFLVATLARRGLLRPGSPTRVLRQFGELRRWGFGLAGELRQAAAREPDRVAVIDESGSLTYGQLLDRSQRLARVLDVAAGDRVGLLGRNSAAMITTLVAVTMAGADPVLLNTGLAGPQLAAVARDQALRLVVHSPEFDPGDLLALREDRLDTLIASAPTGPPLESPSRPGRTIVLTSGTTGVPKGARRPTPGGFGPLASIIDRIPLRAGVRVMIAAPLFHTWGLAGLQIALALRATVVLNRRFSPAPALETMIRSRCMALIAVPVMLQDLMELPPGPRPPLSVVAVSGSALPGGLATRFMDRYGDILYNLYGSTEASWASIATPADLRAAPGTAGRPPHGTRIAVLDEAGRPVPAGSPGRLFVGNEMLFEGYTAGAASTGGAGTSSAGLIGGTIAGTEPNDDRGAGFSSESGRSSSIGSSGSGGGGGKEMRHGLLATGDVGHIDSAGRVFVDGREDDMIVSGGENVFPSEVENLLADLPEVREVAVIGVPDAGYGQRLAAYLVLHPGAALDGDAVREHVRRFRARFCVPRDVVFLDALPRNATGKVVTRELPGAA